MYICPVNISSSTSSIWLLGFPYYSGCNCMSWLNARSKEMVIVRLVLVIWTCSFYLLLQDKLNGMHCTCLYLQPPSYLVIVIVDCQISLPIGLLFNIMMILSCWLEDPLFISTLSFYEYTCFFFKKLARFEFFFFPGKSVQKFPTNI